MRLYSDAQKLEEICLNIRQTIVKTIYNAGTGHCGGSLSGAEILTALYFSEMRVDPKNPGWPDRDRFVASKGHCSPLVYSILAEKGFFPREELQYFRKLDHILQGHPDMKKVPGIDVSTGSLGLGLSVGIGMALSARLEGRDYHTYVLLGDGELQEGQNWEAAMAANKFGLDNLTAILDNNGVQLDGLTNDIMPLGDLCLKWMSFGWNVIEVDGHDIESIIYALRLAKKTRGRPTILIANTIKGKAVSFMEGRNEWHGKPISRDDYEKAMAELGGGV